jgi:phage-related holin
MINEVKSFFVKLLEILFEAKTSTLAVLMTINYLDLFTKYVFNEFDYLVFLIIAMTLDSLAKSYQILFLNVSNERFSREVFLKGNAKKMFRYSIFLIAIHVVCNFAVNGKKVEIPDGFMLAFYSLLIGIEVNSIFTKIGFKTPKIILELLKVDKIGDKKDNLNDEV